MGEGTGVAPTPPIEPEAEPLGAEALEELRMFPGVIALVWKQRLFATIDRLTRERDGAILTIGYMVRCENCAPGYNAIATAALDGES